MRILVTGGAGFIGSNLVHHLLGAGGEAPEVTADRVVNLDKLTYAGNADNLAALAGDGRHVFVQGDIGDSALVAGLLRDHAIDAVLHLAAESLRVSSRRRLGQTLGQIRKLFRNGAPDDFLDTHQRGRNRDVQFGIQGEGSQSS